MAATDVLRAVSAPEPMAPSLYRVTEVLTETGDVATVTFEPCGEQLAAPAPGQFVMAWAFGVGEVPISVSRVDGDRLLLTVRNVGPVSAAIVGARTGDVLGLRGPFGTAWPVDHVAGRHVLVVAGGLGLAPLRMAIDRLVAVGPATLDVVVGARTPDQVLYPLDLQRWPELGARVHVTVDTADRSWHGAVGTATSMVERLHGGYDLALVCGPELMMTSAARAVLRAGVARDAVWVSLERNMHCGIGHCGRCQLGPLLLCRDGAVVRWDLSERWLEVRGR